MKTITKRTAIQVLGLYGLLNLTACSLFEGESLEGKEVKAVPVMSTAYTASPQCGNAPVYQAQGQTFQVLPSAEGYIERGMATQYADAHPSKMTAGCEHYERLAYSAAHRTLPIPSDVRITRLDTGRSVIVRINDRVPDDAGALIQVSYAAAQILGIQAFNASIPVQVEGLSKPELNSVTDLYVAPDAGLTNSNKSVTPEMKAQAMGKLFYIIVGSYPTQAEAIDTFVKLSAAGLGKAEMATAQYKGRDVHQVRIGPFYTQNEIDNVKNTLESNGLATFRVIGISG